MNARRDHRFISDPVLNKMGLDVEILASAWNYTKDLLDAIDERLIGMGESRLAELLELANLSAVLGNFFRSGVAKSSNGRFVANGPHKYPDLLSQDLQFKPIEIKVALENNKPKGHLVKPGPHLIIRYVLGSSTGNFARGKESRGNVVWLWEIRAGHLADAHFNVSNTKGDSGKTAVVNQQGMAALKTVFCDLSKCPYPHTSPTYKEYVALLAT